MKRLLPILALLATSPCWAAFRSAGTAVSAVTAATTITPGSPAGLAANDIIICYISMDLTSGVATFATGFTTLNGPDSIAAPDGQTAKLAWKRAVGSDTLTITGISTGASKVAMCAAWSGRDTTNPPVSATSATNTSSNASPTTYTANGVTAVASDDLAWFAGLDVTVASATNTLTPPTGYTGQTGFNDASSLSPVVWATKDNVSAGATGTVAGSSTHSGSAGWIAYLIRIPASGGAAAAVCTIALMGAGPC